MLEPRTFREALRQVPVGYPIPFVLACLLAFVLGCFTLSVLAPLPLSWIFAATGVATAGSAIVVLLYATFRRPELLRSGRYSVISQAIVLLMDKETSAEAGSHVGKIVEGMFLAESEEAKHSRRYIENQTTLHREDGDG